MLYCPNCKLLCETTICSRCHAPLRNVHNEDYCFLTEKDNIWAGALSELFTQQQIPFVCQQLLGDGLAARIGPAQERIIFYVPYAFYSQAQELDAQFIA